MTMGELYMVSCSCGYEDTIGHLSRDVAWAGANRHAGYWNSSLRLGHPDRHLPKVTRMVATSEPN